MLCSACNSVIDSYIFNGKKQQTFHKNIFYVYFFASIAQCQLKIFASRNKVNLITSSPHIPSFPGKSSGLLSDIEY